MNRLIPYLLTFILFLGLLKKANAQQDSFVGSWEWNKYENSDNAVNFLLSVGTAEKGILYPALATFKTGNVNYSFTLLLARKDIRKIGIGHHSYTSNGNGNPKLMENFAGFLDLHRNLKGNLEVTLQRLKPTTAVQLINPPLSPEENRIYKAISEDNISLKKISDSAWVSPLTTQILTANPHSPYYGIHDSIFLNSRNISVNFNFKRKTGNGILSLVVNNNSVIDQLNLKEARPEEDIRLDTGLNILVLFTEKFGKKPTTTGKLGIKTEKGETFLDHKEEADANASFIAVRLFYEAKEPTLEESIILKDYYSRLHSPDNITTHPELLLRDSLGNIIPPRARKQTDAELILRKSHNAGSLEVKTQQITLAIWDDAVEDGDTISLRINDKWVVQNMAVKKKPQFLTVQVNPGPNKITFIAENLGAIIPNTSVLEINDGRQRRAFFIDTNLDTNNHVNIIYNPGEH